MKSSTKWILILLGMAMAASGAMILWQRGGGQTAPVARILRDGELVEEIALDKVTASYSFALYGSAGSNTIQVEPGRIRVSAADCPDQVCVEQGYISDGTVPIVCLPHGLVIEIVGGEEPLDGAAG